ncbi:3-isopropylmalate dehydratase small subunit [uncultured Sphingomonas sp.]|uniref:3-isopropylmalate dehydratase small subunit n=1 Tax=uncultured Sphingomonas sp. TaxID=158754 RepID=UPI00260DA8F5|nr:3-isopropylmalate dehydratase small subunit [uncultured Sphingomonas sp.]
MKPWTIVTSRAALLRDADIDTDKILPARFMKGLDRRGLGAHLFADMRAIDSRFLIDPAARILVAGRNFGSGSSREHAVWALDDHGIRCVIAPSFGGIFSGNAATNGLLLVAPAPGDYAALVDLLTETPGTPVTVNLPDCTISAGALRMTFAIDPDLREALLAGLDDIGRTLRHAAAIDAFEDRASTRP